MKQEYIDFLINDKDYLLSSKGYISKRKRIEIAYHIFIILNEIRFIEHINVVTYRKEDDLK